MSWWLRCPSALSPSEARASLVLLLIGWPSTTWVPAVTMVTGPGCSMTPAMTERAALPVHRREQPDRAHRRPAPALSGVIVAVRAGDREAGSWSVTS